MALFNRKCLLVCWLLALCALTWICAEDDKTLLQVMRALPQNQDWILKAVNDLLKRPESDNDVAEARLNGKQYLIAAPLTIVNKRVTGIGPSSRSFVNRDYSELSDDCDNTCKQFLDNLTTRKTTSSEVRPKTNVHTELQMMYGNSGREWLESLDGEVILVYSLHTPCAQIQAKQSYGECAGDFGHFLNMKKANRKIYYFIVVFGGVWELTNGAVSSLYMTKSGIAAFQAYHDTDSDDDSSVYHSVNLINQDYVVFLEYPQGIQLPRLYSNGFQVGNKFKYTETQLLHECFARNSLLGESSLPHDEVHRENYHVEREFYEQYEQSDLDIKCLKKLYKKKLRIEQNNKYFRNRIDIIDTCQEYLDRVLCQANNGKDWPPKCQRPVFAKEFSMTIPYYANTKSRKKMRLAQGLKMLEKYLRSERLSIDRCYTQI